MKKKKTSLLNNVTIGTDLEFLLTRGNDYFPAFHITKATKDNPLDLLNLGEGYKMHYDNVALEIALPYSKVEKGTDFIQNVNTAVKFIKSFSKTNNCLVSDEAVATYKDEFLHHEEGMKAGCSADFNVWSKTINDPPDMTLDIRCAGAHVHIGYSNPKMEINERIVKFMDLYLGVPSVIVDQKSKDRRKLYGKAGAFRQKPYGFEYRSLSNFWALDQTYLEWVYETVDLITSELVENFSFKFSKELITDIVNCINNSDVELAKKICEEYHITIPSNKEVFGKGVKKQLEEVKKSRRGGLMEEISAEPVPIDASRITVEDFQRYATTISTSRRRTGTISNGMNVEVPLSGTPVYWTIGIDTPNQVSQPHPPSNEDGEIDELPI